MLIEQVAEIIKVSRGGFPQETSKVILQAFIDYIEKMENPYPEFNKNEDGSRDTNISHIMFEIFREKLKAELEVKK